MADSKKSSSTEPRTEPITDKEVSAVATRLHELCESLDPKQQALLKLVLARAENSAAAGIADYVTDRSVSGTVKALLGPLVKSGLHTSAWVEAGDPWVQGGAWVEAGDPWVQSGGGPGWVEAGDPWVQSGDGFHPALTVTNSQTDLERFLRPNRRVSARKPGPNDG